MDSSATTTTPTKEKITGSKSSESRKLSENLNPNVSSPGLRFSKSPAIGKSAKKSASRNPNPNPNLVTAVASPPLKKKIRDRKFVIAKKKSRNEESSSPVDCEKCKKAIGKNKCLCSAYESLRASQEEFFKNRGTPGGEVVDAAEVDFEDKVQECEEKVEGDVGENAEDGNEAEANLKRSRDRLLKEAREGVPEPGSGRVMHLVKAFEKLTVLKLDDSEKVDGVEDDGKSVKWALPGLQPDQNNNNAKVLETQVSTSSFCPSDFFLTSESLGLDSKRSYSLDSSQGSFTTSRTSAGGQRSRRNSDESLGTFARRKWKRKQRKARATSQKPFMLRTEERGKCKEEEFMKKLQQMLEEEEKLRVPIAQGLPWTTDEPECLVKPPVKEKTRPVDPILHTDVRAMERAEFDQQVAEKMSLIEQYRMEREMRQKLEEEEEIRRLRKVLVPKAQPMPYFDRPFIPRRSSKHPTIPKEPKLHVPQHKKIRCNMSFDGLSVHSGSDWQRMD